MRLFIACENRPGIAHEVLDILVRYDIDLRGIEFGPTGQIYLSFQELDLNATQQLMPEIRRLDDVTDVVIIPYMPIEREHQELQTLLYTLPDPVISFDQRGNIIVANEAALETLKLDESSARGKKIKQWIKGFNLDQWLNNPENNPVSSQLDFAGCPYLANFYPVKVPGENDDNDAFAGGVLLLQTPLQLSQQVAALQKQPGHFEFIHAKSTDMKRVIRQAKKIAELDAPLLITGETGVGKELIANACHQQSLRRNNPFVALNCAGLPIESAESELFGTLESSEQIRKGVFEQANGGTVFLQEVGELPAQIQSKLLRLLQNGSFRRVGSEQEIQVDIRVICSTKKDLPKLCKQGLFREDLYYRLNVLKIDIPPLRYRREDILPLARYFLQQHASASRHRVKLSEEAISFIQQYDWPGNVRQLQNAILHAASITETNILEPDHFQLPSHAEGWGYLSQDAITTLDEAVHQFESELLRRLFPAYPSSRKLGQRLGISHTAIANKLRDYGIGKSNVNK